MYHSTGVQKLRPSQMSKLRTGKSVRIKLGSGNTLNLTDQQIKKLQSAHKKRCILYNNISSRTRGKTWRRLFW
jgi:hypothetical protein